MSDADIKARVADIPCPTFDDPAFVTPPALADATVAIVTTAALHHPEDDQFDGSDVSFRVLDGTRPDWLLGHWSPNFDRTGFVVDLNVVYPIDRLEELAADGTIAAVAPRHVSFAGNQPDDVGTVRLDTGPAAAAELVADGVHVVVLTPV